MLETRSPDRGWSGPARPPPAAGLRPVIRVICPAATLGPHLSALEAGLARLERAGCEVRFDQARVRDQWRGYFAGDPAVRASEVLDALAEPGVDIVWAARGGAGCLQIVDAVVAGAARLPPRALVGFSDLTVLLNALHDHLGWITFHGPVVTTLGRSELAVDLDGVLATLRGERHVIEIPRGPSAPISGRLRGGNLSLLAAECGTPTALQPGTDDIWLIEDVSATHYQLDRCFSQLRRSGAFAGARALWIGDLDLPPNFAEVVCCGFAEDSGLPTVTGAPAGHRGRLEALPIGGQVELIPQEGRLRAVGNWTRPARSSRHA